MVNLNTLGLEEYLENCIAVSKLTKWIVAIRTTGNGRGLPQEISGLPYEIDMIIRSGPGSTPSNSRNFFAARKYF